MTSVKNVGLVIFFPYIVTHDHALGQFGESFLWSFHSTIFLLFISDLQSLNYLFTPSYKNNQTKSFITLNFECRTNYQQTADARSLVLEQLIFDLSRICNCSRETWVFSLPQALSSFIILLNTIFRKTSLAFFKTQFKPSIF